MIEEDKQAFIANGGSAEQYDEQLAQQVEAILDEEDRVDEKEYVQRTKHYRKELHAMGMDEEDVDQLKAKRDTKKIEDKTN